MGNPSGPRMLMVVFLTSVVLIEAHPHFNWRFRYPSYHKRSGSDIFESEPQFCQNRLLDAMKRICGSSHHYHLSMEHLPTKPNGNVGIIERCCLNTCNISTLQLYCPPRSSFRKTEEATTTTTTPTPTTPAPTTTTRASAAAATQSSYFALLFSFLKLGLPSDVRDGFETTQRPPENELLEPDARVDTLGLGENVLILNEHEQNGAAADEPEIITTTARQGCRRRFGHPRDWCEREVVTAVMPSVSDSPYHGQHGVKSSGSYSDDGVEQMRYLRGI